MLEWQDEAACAVYPDLWFGEKGSAHTARRAKMVCRTACPVRSACLEYALANNESFGVWGGMTERERRAEKRRRTP